MEQSATILQTLVTEIILKRVSWKRKTKEDPQKAVGNTSIFSVDGRLWKTIWDTTDCC